MSEHASKTLRRLEQRARKRFGQNFLVDQRAIKSIVHLSRAKPGTKVLEIGPGLGALSRGLMATGAHVRAVELDRDLVAHLQEELPELELISGDAVKLPLEEMAPGSDWAVCANLPYNVSTRILMRLLPERDRFTHLVLMFQREVAHRIVASPHTKAFGSLSVMCQVLSTPRLELELKPGSFHPSPKVHSSVVRFRLLDEPRTNGVPLEDFERLVRAGFHTRRKTLLNAISQRYDREQVRAALEATGLSGRRAEQLSIGDWGELAAAMATP